MGDKNRDINKGCLSVLDAWDMTFVVSDDGKSFQIFDADGNYRFTASKRISEFDLLQALRYGNFCFKQGKREGRSYLQTELRRLVGIQETPVPVVKHQPNDYDDPAIPD